MVAAQVLNLLSPGDARDENDSAFNKLFPPCPLVVPPRTYDPSAGVHIGSVVRSNPRAWVPGTGGLLITGHGGGGLPFGSRPKNNPPVVAVIRGLAVRAFSPLIKKFSRSERFEDEVTII